MLTPVIALLFGRGLTATLAIATSVIFFSAFVIISQGLANAPGNALDLMRSYNAALFWLWCLQSFSLRAKAWVCCFSKRAAS